MCCSRALLCIKSVEKKCMPTHRCCSGGGGHVSTSGHMPLYDLDLVRSYTSATYHKLRVFVWFRIRYAKVNKTDKNKTLTFIPSFID